MKRKPKAKPKRKPLKKLIIANWKMNPRSLDEAKKLFSSTNRCASGLRKVDTVVAAPYPYLGDLARLAKGKSTKLAAQDMFYEPHGAFTGEVSAGMLRSIGVSMTIIGHSERRSLGEDDESVAKKMAAAVRTGISPVLCVGERERTHSGSYFSFVERQLRLAFAEVPKNRLYMAVVAYEPIWAIGTGQNATPDDAHQMYIFIQKTLTHLYDRTSASAVRVLYGGSVNEKNAEELLRYGEVDGFLVGGASLRDKEFNSILKTANAIKR